MAMSFQYPKKGIICPFLQELLLKKTRSQIIGNKDVREVAMSHVRMQINCLKIDPDSCQ